MPPFQIDPYANVGGYGLGYSGANYGYGGANPYGAPYNSPIISPSLQARGQYQALQGRARIGNTPQQRAVHNPNTGDTPDGLKSGNLGTTDFAGALKPHMNLAFNQSDIAPGWKQPAAQQPYTQPTPPTQPTQPKPTPTPQPLPNPDQPAGSRLAIDPHHLSTGPLQTATYKGPGTQMFDRYGYGYSHPAQPTDTLATTGRISDGTTDLTRQTMIGSGELAPPTTQAQRANQFAMDKAVGTGYHGPQDNPGLAAASGIGPAQEQALRAAKFAKDKAAGSPLYHGPGQTPLQINQYATR